MHTQLKQIVARLRLLTAPLTYNQDGLATQHNCDFIRDTRFIEAYAQGKSTGSWGKSEIHWRAYICCWAADRARTREGDFVECGVNRGGLARTVMQYVDFKSLDKRFYLLDTFSGLVEKYITAEERQAGIQPGGYEECYDAVRETFRDLANVVVIRGAVPDTLPLVPSEKISYLSIDMNCAEPEIAAAEYFWDRLVSGAILIVDDYGWAGHGTQKRAFDDFARRRNVQVLSLPTGQGLVFRH